MGTKTGIAWCHHTFNCWWGCTMVSPACTNCYAEAWDARMGGDHWGPRAPRKTFGDKHWAEPLRWHRAAVRDGVRRRVFCASMADVFEHHDDPAVNAVLVRERARLWKLIGQTPQLDWLLLTKRPENISVMLPTSLADWNANPMFNVWLGTTTEDQKHYNARVPHLLGVRAAVHFISAEPMLGPIKLMHCELSDSFDSRVDWVITGSESGSGRRDSDVDWYRSLRDQCARHGAAFFLKQAQPASETIPPTRGFLPVVREGDGSWSKRDGTIELPYLDGKQHADFPQPRFRTMDTTPTP